MLTFLTLPSPPPDNEADPSLSMVLNYAQQQGLQFGTDIVSTYGPLGFLIFPYFASQASSLRVSVTLALCYLVALGLCFVAGRLPVWWRWLLPGIFVWVASNIEHRGDLVLDA